MTLTAFTISVFQLPLRKDPHYQFDLSNRYQVFLQIYTKLYITFFTRMPPNDCFSIIYVTIVIFFPDQLVAPKIYFIILANIVILFSQVVLNCQLNLGYFPRIYWSCFFHQGVELKFTECVSFYRIRKTLRFHYEAKIYLQNNI